MTIRRPDPRVVAEAPAGDELADAVLIRPHRDEDTALIREIVVESLAEFGFEPDDSGMDVDLSDLGRHYRHHGGEFWVVEDGFGRVVGTCGVWPDPDDRTRCELRKMYLRPMARGGGLGRRLLETAIDHARRAGWVKMELETASAMHAAIGLYRSAGFVEVETSSCGGRCDRKFAIEL